MFDQLKNLAQSALGGFKIEDILKMFPNDFIANNSVFASFNDLLSKFGFDATNDGIAKLQSNEFSNFLKENSNFSSLQDMISKVTGK